ncbi:uncharacterized protein METZ01_LOCUS208748 [marine metagenome]|uniref:DUF1648 domain-containing protein n=1 Tax=marine metagenome TaxID=408172 RepID=A0A382F0J6_9ZZZZ
MTSRWFGLIIISCVSLFALWVFPSIQTPVPIHSSEMAQVDLWASPFEAIILPPIMILVFYLIMLANRPNRYLTAHEQYIDRVSWLFLNMGLAVICVMYIALLGRSLGWVSEVRRAVILAFGLATIILSYYLPKVRSHEWLGIRTPWTLANSVIWKKTHHLAQWSFLVGGLMICVASWLQKPYRRDLSMLGFVMAVGIPTIYSYFIWRRDMRRFTRK